MAYDLHVVRSIHWADAADSPITKSDVDALVEDDPELAWSDSELIIEAKDENGAVTAFYMIRWNGTPCFWWYRGQVVCCGPNDRQVAKLVRIAAALNARVVGDDGERYELRRSLLGKEKITRTPG
jgi:hypothetical protein